jgi:SOS response regulatory protein OraA/RecX
MKKGFSENTIKNIVNEEQNEDDKDNEEKMRKIPRKKFVVDINSELDLANSKFGKLKFTKSFREINFLETLYEIKEEQCPDVTVDKKSLIKLQSPQIKFLTDNIEDTTVCPTYFTSNHVSSFKFDYVEEEQVIAEDNNENNLELTVLKKSHSNKKLETFIDKSENFDDNKKQISDNIIEEIKEENNEEEEVNETANYHQNNKSEYLISDEVGPNDKTKLKYRLSMKGKTSYEENKIINELDDEF